jgi:transmembrane sensor
MTPYPSHLSEDDTVHDAAIAWRVRHQLRELEEAEQAEFRAWLDAAPAHRSAYAEIEEVWDTSGELGHHPLYLETRERAITAVDRLRMGRRAIAAGLAAALIGLGGGGLYLHNAPKPLATQAFHTAVGQRATITLPDGSEVTLNTNSIVRTQAAEDKRLVFLDSGQAFFRVAKDRRHPFVVTAAGRTVTAVGTAFDVRVDHGELKVVLVEGKVRVAPVTTAPRIAPTRSATSPQPVVTDMSAGSQLVVVNDTDWRLTPTDVARETSWLKGQLVFDDEALGDIVEEMNRYSERKIVLNDSRLAAHRLSGNFTPGDVRGFARMLRTGGVASLRERADGEVEIVPLQ